MGPGSPALRAYGREDKLWLSAVTRPMVGDHVYFVYMLASCHYGTLYTGVTNDLIARIWEHKDERAPGFTKRYGVKRLVWFEQHSGINEALRREKRIQRWRRDWKIVMIEETNPHWTDLYPALIKAGWRARR